MYDKRFLKVKKLGEERLFRDERELWKFFESQEGTWFLKSDVLGEEKMTWWWLCHTEPLHSDSNVDMFIAGKFLFQLTRGNFIRTSGDYKYCVLAMSKSDNFSLNDIKKLFKIQ
ncbi:MAG: hypothetical protein LBS69_06025 [Prevotellaceae bacterium]|jgi:hypothetical protein|nr:hypothetical protein [Prevotellaceae bacterium]